MNAKRAETNAPTDLRSAANDPVNLTAVQPVPFSGYWDIRDLCVRFRKAKRTIYRWMTEKEFPRPHLADDGIDNLWAIEHVLAWEELIASRKRA